MVPLCHISVSSELECLIIHHLTLMVDLIYGLALAALWRVQDLTVNP